MPRLVKVEAGIKANVVPARPGLLWKVLTLRHWRLRQRLWRRRQEFLFVLEGDLPVMTVTAQGEGAHASTPQEGKNALQACWCT